MSNNIFVPGQDHQRVALDSLPDKCDCPEAFGDFNRHRLIRVRGPKGVIKFCEKSRRGWIQYDSGFIIDGVFRGNRDGD